jgi:type II secretory pathway component PulL
MCFVGLLLLAFAALALRGAEAAAERRGARWVLVRVVLGFVGLLVGVIGLSVLFPAC